MDNSTTNVTAPVSIHVAMIATDLDAKLNPSMVQTLSILEVESEAKNTIVAFRILYAIIMLLLLFVYNSYVRPEDRLKPKNVLLSALTASSSLYFAAQTYWYLNPSSLSLLCRLISICVLEILYLHYLFQRSYDVLLVQTGRLTMRTITYIIWIATAITLIPLVVTIFIYNDWNTFFFIANTIAYFPSPFILLLGIFLIAVYMRQVNQMNQEAREQETTLTKETKRFTEIIYRYGITGIILTAISLLFRTVASALVAKPKVSLAEIDMYFWLVGASEICEFVNGIVLVSQKMKLVFLADELVGDKYVASEPETVQSVKLN
ncbi:hypothetical protein HDU79_008360 [Rhizoclosmatium sp. JEL0117]|nr:hypothetical protein HDU79_008360 [Rhizoclosmatium sp. JEL0117]